MHMPTSHIYNLQIKIRIIYICIDEFLQIIQIVIIIMINFVQNTFFVT